MHDMKFLIEKEVEYNPGIYRITNVNSNKVYIGSTNSLRVRFNGHNSFLVNQDHHSDHLQNSFNKHGGDCFVFEALRVFDQFIWDFPLNKIKEILLSEEQFWIDWYDASNKKLGYNMCPKAGSTLGLKHSEKDNIRKAEVSKKSWLSEEGRNNRMNAFHSLKKWVLVYSYPEGRFIGKFKGVTLTSEYLSQETGITIDKWSMIYSICNQSSTNKKYSQGHLSSHGYTFRWWDEKSTEPVWIDLSESEEIKLKRKADSRNAQKIGVLKNKKWFLVYDRFTGNFIKEVLGLEEACLEFNIPDNSRIVNNANGRNGYASDYIFKYKLNDNYPLKIEARPIRYKSNDTRQSVLDANRKDKGRGVVGYKDGIFFKEFFSVPHVMEEVNITIRKLLTRIKNGQDYQGYTFKYKDPNYKSRKYKKPKQQLATLN